MRKDSEDKAERILSIYERLKCGKVIYKEKLSFTQQVGYVLGILRAEIRRRNYRGNRSGS